MFHGQHHASPDFSTAEGIDWFVEGLATYASGQYDDTRRSEVLESVKAGKFPSALEGFWRGPLRYGLSASLLHFMDQRYGRQKVRSLLPYSTLSEVLQALDCTESELLNEWREFLMS